MAYRAVQLGIAARVFGVDVAPGRIIVTAGASAALHLACLALIEAGDEILMPDPSYPCNRHFVGAAEGRSTLIPTTAAERFQLTADKVDAAWGAQTRGVLLASPSNPTGTSMAPDELQRLHSLVHSRGGITLMDEIYLGLSHDDQFGQSALGLGDDVISINSFNLIRVLRKLCFNCSNGGQLSQSSCFVFKIILQKGAIKMCS